MKLIQLLKQGIVLKNFKLRDRNALVLIQQVNIINIDSSSVGFEGWRIVNFIAAFCPPFVKNFLFVEKIDTDEGGDGEWWGGRKA